jgi:methionyl-tRNA formyltransferase
VPRQHASSLQPGMISTAVTETGLYVGAGHDGTVEILDLQPAGKRRMMAGEFLHGYVIKPGWQLGGESP